MSQDQSREFTAAMRAGDWDRSDRLLGDLGTHLPDHLLSSIADLHMVRQRWDQATDALTSMKYRDKNAEMRLKLSRNLFALQTHRPRVYRALIDAPPSNRFSLGISRTGHPTVFFRNDQGGMISLSADNDPLGGIQRAMKTVDAAYKGGKAIGLTGIGDGYLLNQFAKNPPTLILGREHVITLVEPEAHLVMACLMIHDYTGADGPIQQPRFAWYIGPDWLNHLREDFLSDLFLLYPTVLLRTGLQSTKIEAELEQFLKEIAALDDQLIAKTNGYYSRYTRDDLLSALGENPPRKPRALVITTRFSTVLQFSCADTAEAFRKLGWDVKLLIEPSTIHGMNRIAMRQAIADFKPDLVFQIDHLRSEYPDLFPANLVSVCWIQDHLQNLMNATAGTSITPLDFVLVENAQMYQEKFSYPARQCIYLNKATRLPPIPECWEQTGDEIVFVSNCSHDPQQLADKLWRQIEDVKVQAVTKEMCDRMLKRYADGGSICTLAELDAALDTIEKEHNIRAGIGTQRDIFLHALWHPFNDTLYRQQALRWAVHAADQMGLSLGLYGNGWEKNAEFSSHARGYAKYGPELEELTRRTKVNLHIVPFSCVHQRLLDGIACGGFFMIRDHPANHLAADMRNFLEQHVPPNLPTMDAVRQILSGDLLSEFDAIITRYRRLNSTGDPVARVRSAVHPGLTSRLPHLESVSFNSAEEFKAKLTDFLTVEELRRKTTSDQRKFVEKYFTYESNLKRILGTIRQLIATESSAAAIAA